MTLPARIPAALVLCAGMIVGPGVWALNMQLGQILPYTDCAANLRLSTVVSVLVTFAAIASGGISWRCTRGRHGVEQSASVRFIGSLSAMTAFIIAFALVLQIAASLVLTGCER